MSNIINGIDHQILEDLKQFELTTYEAQVYATLLSLGSAEASQIAKESDVPQSRVYDVLHSLEEKGLLTKSPGSPKVFSANRARRGLEHLVYRINKAREERISFLRSKIDELSESLPEYAEQQESTRIAWVTEGTYPIACKLIEGMQNAEHSMDVFGDSPIIRLKSRSAFDKHIEDRSIKIRALGVFDQDTILEMERHDADVREFRGPQQSYFIFDEMRLLQVSSDVNGSPRGLITEESALVQTYLDRFERHWADTKPTT